MRQLGVDICRTCFRESGQNVSQPGFEVDLVVFAGSNQAVKHVPRSS